MIIFDKLNMLYKNHWKKIDIRYNIFKTVKFDVFDTLLKRTKKNNSIFTE